MLCRFVTIYLYAFNPLGATLEVTFMVSLEDVSADDSRCPAYILRPNNIKAVTAFSYPNRPPGLTTIFSFESTDTEAATSTSRLDRRIWSHNRITLRFNNIRLSLQLLISTIVQAHNTNSASSRSLVAPTFFSFYQHCKLRSFDQGLCDFSPRKGQTRLSEPFRHSTDGPISGVIQDNFHISNGPEGSS